MFEYRVTKYDPALRDAKGAYKRDEWTSFKDIGQSFDGVVLTRAEYERVEDAYVAAALAFLKEAGLSGLVVAGLENSAGHALPFGNGSFLNLDQVERVIRRVLREEFWCRLEGPVGFVHLGWDYYMYIGVRCLCSEAQELTRRQGLFVEAFPSPYGEQ